MPGRRNDALRSPEMLSEKKAFKVQTKIVASAIVDVVCGIIVYAHEPNPAHREGLYGCAGNLVDELTTLAEMP